MSHEHQIDIDHHVRTYMYVFGALMVLTIITVAVANLHLSVGLAVALALFIAAIKGTLVACFFMHLISERRMIYLIMAFTVFFFLFCLLVPLITNSDSFGHITGAVH